MKVKDLKSILSDALDELDMFEDEIEIDLQTNTYFVRNARYFLGTRNGYLDLGNISNSINDDEDYFDNEE